jgi:hypothetical protein
MHLVLQGVLSPSLLSFLSSSLLSFHLKDFPGAGVPRRDFLGDEFPCGTSVESLAVSVTGDG